MKTLAGRLVSAVLLCMTAAGCGTLANGRGWGQDATLLPGWERLGDAFVGAVSDPLTWVPVLTAAVLQVDDLDESISEWAAEETPVFGSREDATDARGYLGDISDAVYWSSVALTPSGDRAMTWVGSKAKGAAVGVGAQVLTFQTVDVLKEAAGRSRPNDANNRSFPSEHAARLAVASTLSSRNVRAMPLPEGGQVALHAGLTTLTALGAWSRLEAGAHYPSDVLTGIGIGHFWGAFVNDAFMGLDESSLRLDVTLDDGLFTAGLAGSF